MNSLTQLLRSKCYNLQRYIVFSELKRSRKCLGMEENELCKTIKLRNGCCKICLFYIINFKHYMVAWSNFQVNWDQIIIIENALLYETRRWNSLDCSSSWGFRLAWASDKTRWHFPLKFIRASSWKFCCYWSNYWQF